MKKFEIISTVSGKVDFTKFENPKNSQCTKSLQNMFGYVESILNSQKGCLGFGNFCYSLLIHIDNPNATPKCKQFTKPYLCTLIIFISNEETPYLLVIDGNIRKFMKDFGNFDTVSHD